MPEKIGEHWSPSRATTPVPGQMDSIESYLSCVVETERYNLLRIIRLQSANPEAAPTASVLRPPE